MVVSVDGLLTGAEEDLIVVVPLSTSRAPSDLRPTVGPESGIDRNSVAVCRAVRTVARRRFRELLGTVGTSTLAEIEDALAVVLGIERS